MNRDPVETRSQRASADAQHRAAARRREPQRARRGRALNRYATGLRHARRRRMHAEAVGPEVRVVGGHLLLGLQVRDRAVERGIHEGDVFVGLAAYRLAPGPRRREQRRDSTGELVDVDQRVGVGR
jgi:hypothetical protein